MFEPNDPYALEMATRRAARLIKAFSTAYYVSELDNVLNAIARDTSAEQVQKAYVYLLHVLAARAAGGDPSGA